MSGKGKNLMNLNFGSPAFIRLIRDSMREVLLIERGIIRKPKHSLKPFLATNTSHVMAVNTDDNKLILNDIGNIDNETEFYFDEDDPVTVTETNVTSANSVELTVTVGNEVGVFNLHARNGNEDNYGVVAVHIALVAMMIPGNAAYPWTDVTSQLAVGEGSIKSTNPTRGGWDQSATVDTLTFSTDGLVKATYMGKAIESGSTPYGMIGLSANPGSGLSYRDIDYALYVRNGTGIFVYEKGRNVFSRNKTLFPGDKLLVKRIGTIVSYSYNGVVIYTSKTPSVGTIGFDNSIYRNTWFNDITVSTDIS